MSSSNQTISWWSAKGTANDKIQMEMNRCCSRSGSVKMTKRRVAQTISFFRLSGCRRHKRPHLQLSVKIESVRLNRIRMMKHLVAARDSHSGYSTRLIEIKAFAPAATAELSRHQALLESDASIHHRPD